MQKLDLENADESKINAFKMKALRRLLHVSCTDRRTKKWVLQKARPDLHLLTHKTEAVISWIHYTEPGKKTIQGTAPGLQTRKNKNMLKEQCQEVDWVCRA